MGDEFKDQEELEKYGVWVKAGPEEVMAADESGDFDLSDLPTDDVFDDTDLDVLGDLDAVDAIPTESTEDIDSVEELDISDLDDGGEDDDIVTLSDDDIVAVGDDDIVTLDDLDVDEPEGDTDPFEALDVDDDLLDEIEPTLPEEEHDFTPDEQGIEIESGQATVLTSEEEEYLAEDLQITEESDTHSGMDPQERSAFEKIQEELEDIKSELAQLRQQLAGVSVPAESAVDEITLDDLDDMETAVEESAEPQDEAATHGTGFFDDDEDETIALTGDELDNILNTAEFTEETGEAEELEDVTLEDTDELTLDDADDITIDQDIVEEVIEDTADLDSFGAEEKARQLDELAEMDIDEELAGIDELVDDSETENLDEIELDLDELDTDAEEETTAEVEDLDIEGLDLPGDEETLEIETEVEEASDGIDDLDVTVDELEDDFDTFADEVERDIAGDEDVETGADETPDIETIDLDVEESVPETAAQPTSIGELPDNIKDEIRSVLSYMDQLLEALPDEKIQEFAQSEHFSVYKRLFEELGLEN